MNRPTSSPGGPAQWEADVVLADGGIAQLRPITADDRANMIAFYSRVSDQSKYLRFFATHPTLSDQELDEYTNPDNHDRVALLLAVDGDVVAFAHYEILPDLLPDRVANVAFLVQDDQQGRGVGNILLEHLAEVGRECGVERFTAEMLTQNRRMVQVFTRAGYSVRPELADGCILVDFPLAATPKSRQVMEQREHKAESNAIRGLLTPRRVAVVGEVSQTGPILASIAAAGLRGELLAVTSTDTSAGSHGLRRITGDVDLVVVRSGTDDLESLIVEASRKNARGILVLAGTSPSPLGQDEARQLVSWARTHGLRALGPTALGMINTDPDVRLNASPARTPRRGVVGLFAQSAGVATIVLARAQDLGIGLSSFIATGAFADVTGNDVMQYWTDDEATRVCLLSLDSVGNPRKFFRVLRRLALTKPVVIFTPSRALNSARHDELDLPSAPATALDQVIAQSGAIVVDRRDIMYDIAQLIARQPMPGGRRVRVISNSAGLTHQMAQAALRFGLEPGDGVVVHAEPAAEELVSAAAAAVDSGEVDAVVCAVVEVVDPLLEQVHAGLAEIAARTRTVPVVGVFVSFRGAPAAGQEEDDGMGRLPTFTHYADALQALSLVAANREDRERRAPDPEAEPLPVGRAEVAREIIDQVLADSPEGRWATDDECACILEAYGITLVPWRATNSLDEAVAAGSDLGWDVVLKATARLVRGRSELATSFFHLADADEMRRAWESLGRTARDLGLTQGNDPTPLVPVVQTTMQPGTPLTVRGIEDAVLGPMICVGVAGPPSDLLGDLAWGVPPLDRGAARAMLDQLQAAPLLHGYRGSRPVDMTGIQDILVRLARLKDDQAAVAEVELSPALASPQGTAIVGGRIRIVPMPAERDPLARRAT
ncbi:acyl-CoA synthetase (NDP forming) [Luteococcus japonicus]|uniref:Acyl-CoA synthetase (NDP forming) n=1 Tax=Luteococcus japonicus TaxID=33984 RepID=A0A3N1ZSW9_9ACTN|nr:GNAT family N-acetyltransferase [Luteococcus japonicus]ROR53956.1 acyl-CoA synthetase (NDP forming) [Luteococcus japonicus]